MSVVEAAEPLLEVHNLTKTFKRTKGIFRKVQSIVRAVDNVSFTIRAGETLSLVGESGSGKTTTGRCIIRALDPDSGEVIFHDDGARKLTQMDQGDLIAARRKIRMIFQDPFSSLNPRMTLLKLIGEPLVIHKFVSSRAELQERVADLLRMVHLDPKYLNRYPHAFSGGQRQRIAIARALALKPKFVIADEPVSALDVSVQAQVLNLLKELQRDNDLTYLLIAHNLAVVRYQSDRVAVMYLGKIVELGTRDSIYALPLHPYTESLLAAAPDPDPRSTKKTIGLVKGEIPDPAHRPTGCAFHTRCQYAQVICGEKEPLVIDARRDDDEQHLVACHFWNELRLAGTRG